MAMDWHNQIPNPTIKVTTLESVLFNSDASYGTVECNL